ncbi:hypothetical protein JCM8097_003177 [Rhodosporidiobolus ruineniae]
MPDQPQMPTAASAAVLAAIDFSTARSHARHQSLSSTASADSVLEAVVEDPKESAVGPQDSTWASPALASAAQAPVLTYHDGTSGDSIATIASTFHARQEPARKRFKAPFQPHILDRDVGNPKPWMKGRKTISRDKRSYFTTLFGITVGFALGLYSIISGCLDVERDKYDLLLDEQFDGDSLNSSAWRVEQRVGGGESNDFTWFTGHNSYVADGSLWIVPTLTNDTLLSTDYALMNDTYLQLGSACDSIHQSDCFIAADTENNQTLVIPPVQSAMITTRGKINMQYGRVVMRARTPTGDWLWPQISLVSEHEEYGVYPASGLITVFESRGNKAQHRLDQLNNEMVSGLHWGPAGASSYDRFYLTQGLFKLYRRFFNTQYYEFGIDWTPRSISIWINSRTRIAFRYGFGTKKFWDVGNFGYSYSNGTIITNPWANAENVHTAPFDKSMYLRIALLAGGTDGYWLDDLPDKPWRNSDARPQAMQRFLDYVGVWMPTWPSGDKIRQRGLAIDSVQLYQWAGRK